MRKETDEREKRKARLAAELRANLARRKAQARARRSTKPGGLESSVPEARHDGNE